MKSALSEPSTIEPKPDSKSTEAGDAPPKYDDSKSSIPAPRHAIQPNTADQTARRSASALAQSPPGYGHHPLGSGAPAASVSAILAYPGPHPADEKKQKRTWKELLNLRARRRNWKERHAEFGSNRTGGSRAEFNVMGARI